MDIFQALILGIMEGVTEFLPISSTGHLIIVSDFLGLNQNEYLKAFEVIIQLASILAVITLYKDRFNKKNLSLWYKILIAFLPLGIIGYIFRYEVKELFSIQVVSTMFIFGGVVFLIVEKFYDNNKNRITKIEEVSFRHSIIIGFFQVLALIPGTSRAGSTVIGGLLCGLDRKVSAEFSFLLALPVMFVTSGYDILKHHKVLFDINFTSFIIGFLTSFIVALLVIKLFLKFLERFTFVAFGIYRIIFGFILIYLYHT